MILKIEVTEVTAKTIDTGWFEGQKNVTSNFETYTLYFITKITYMILCLLHYYSSNTTITGNRGNTTTIGLY